MILVDANILIYATNADSDRHSVATSWLNEQLGGLSPVGLPWATILSFLRLSTNSRIFGRPLTVAIAWQQVAAWLDAAPTWIPQPTERHAEVLGAMVDNLGAHGNLVPDAHLAALAIEHGLTLCSVDGDFARFRGLRWTNPLAA